MNFGPLSRSSFNKYQGCSNEFKIGATAWKHIMYEREHLRCEARIWGLGACSSGKILKKSVQLGDFSHIFRSMQFIPCSESIIFQQAKS